MGIIDRLFFRRAVLPLPLICLRTALGTWCAAQLAGYASSRPDTKQMRRIESLARQADALGEQPLWEGYAGQQTIPGRFGKDMTRRAAQVSKTTPEGAFFTWLVQQRKPRNVLEFGTAFGVSGMYWLAGLEANASGELLTFEPNAVWAAIAAKNLAAISPRFTLTNGIFEDHVPRLLSEKRAVDIAFIDAIHTSAFVNRQLELVLQLAAPGALIIIDDINFSDDMRACWQNIAMSDRFVAAYMLGERVGIVELAQ